MNNELRISSTNSKNDISGPTELSVFDCVLTC